MIHDDASRLTLDESDPVFNMVQHLGAEQRAPEAGDPQQSRAPVGESARIVDEPAQRGLNLDECAGRHHEAAERQGTREIERRRCENRRNEGEPAVSCGDPGKIHESREESAHRQQNAREIELDAPRLLGLPAGECDRVDMFVHADQ